MTIEPDFNSNEQSPLITNGLTPRLQWHVDALLLYQNTAHPVSEIAYRFGKSEEALTKAAQRFGVKRRAGHAPSGRPAGIKRRQITAKHRALGVKITERRNLKADPLTQGEMADALGITLPMLQDLEAGFLDPYLSLLLRISELLGLTVDELLTPNTIRKQ